MTKIHFYIYGEDDGLLLPQKSVDFLRSPYFNDWLTDGPDYAACQTCDASVADFFVLPYPLDELARSYGPQEIKGMVRALPHYAGNTARHIFMKGDTGGKTSFRLNSDACILNLNPSPTTREQGDIPIHHCIGADISGCYSSELGRVRYHINFMGCLTTHPVRMRMAAALHSAADLGIFFRPQTTSYWFLSPEERKGLRQEYIDSMLDSWLILCPRGTGSSSVRMYEALALGRIPVVISDDYIFPLQNEVNYTDFCIVLPESEVENLSGIVGAWLRKNQKMLPRKCLAARDAWQKHFSCFSYVRKLLLEKRMHSQCELS